MHGPGGQRSALPDRRLERQVGFVGRAVELDTLADALARVPVVVVCGVPGLGKSALAAAFAATWSGPVVRSDVSGALVELVEDTRRLLGSPASGELGALDDRVRALARRLDAAGSLWLIDDLHRLPPADRRSLLRVLGAALQRGRALATSRERIGIDPGGPDHAEMRLAGLGEADGRELWLMLDQLYGASHGVEQALARCDGNPFLLRRAHAGDLADEDPIAESIAQLDAGARRMAGALALSDVRLPVTVLTRLVVDKDGREGLRQLSGRLIVDVHADGEVSMHDLLRDRIRQTIAGPERIALLEDLAQLLPDSDLDAVRRTREVCRHLRALDRDEEAVRYLIERSPELEAIGAAGELMRGLDAIPAERRTPEASVVLARAAARVLDFQRSFAEHERLVAAGIGPRPEMALTYALVALSVGRPELAELAVGDVLAARGLPARLRARAFTIGGIVSVFGGPAGRGDELLRAGLAEFEEPALAAPLWLYRAYALWVEERDAEAYDAIRRALALRTGIAISYRSSVLTAMTQGLVAACLGRVDEADAALREAEQLVSRDDDLLLTMVRFGRAWYRWESGAWVEALTAIGAVADQFHLAGHLVGELMSRVLQIRILFGLGRRREADVLLEATGERARRHRLSGVERAVGRSRLYDPLRWLERVPTVDAGRRPSAAAVAGSMKALLAAAAGEREPTAAPLAGTAQPAHGLGRMVTSLAEAVADIAGGGACGAPLARAHAAATAAGADPDLVHVLLRGLGGVRLVAADRARIAPEGDVPASAAIVVDARTDELRIGQVTTRLEPRPMLRRLLYALARRPGAVVSKDELAEAMWSRPFNPVTDAGTLKTNVGNLRKLLDPGGVSIAFSEVGYRLTGAERLLYIESIAWPPDPAAPRRT